MDAWASAGIKKHVNYFFSGRVFVSKRSQNAALLRIVKGAEIGCATDLTPFQYFTVDLFDIVNFVPRSTRYRSYRAPIRRNYFPSRVMYLATKKRIPLTGVPNMGNDHLSQPTFSQQQHPLMTSFSSGEMHHCECPPVGSDSRQRPNDVSSVII